MKQIDVSLLWPRDKEEFAGKTAQLFPATVENLEIPLLCASLCKSEDDRKTVRGVLTEFCRDEEVIRYRQGVFGDFICLEKLTSAFEDILEALRRLEHIIFKGNLEEGRLWELFSRYKELEAYVDCVTAVAEAMRDVPLKSEGMLAFREKALKLTQDEEFVALAGVVKSLDLEINEIRSITLGINLDSTLNPESVVNESVNKTQFKDNFTLLQAISAAAHVVTPDDVGAATRLHKVSDDRRDPIMYALYKEIDKYLRPVIKQLSAALNKYAKVYTGYLANVIPEIVFYLSFVKLYRKLGEKGMACALPAVANAADRVCSIENGYNLNLALHMLAEGRDPAKEIVANDVSFGEEGRVLIITGPNRGGKTVYTGMIGLAQVLFQAGVFVPGSSAEISPADNIYSHFPADESQTVELGRLGEETKRLGEIFGEATRMSLILLNESLTSTSYSEGLYLAKEVVRAMRYLGARAIFNTHLHELAEDIEELNSGTAGDSMVQSLVTGIVEGRRSYIVEPGAPAGKSYAMDIAMKFGVSLRQIAEVIDKKVPPA